MKNLFALILVALLSTTIIPNKAFAQINSAALEIKEQCTYDGLMTVFILVSENSEKKWELMEDASKMIVSEMFNANKDLNRIVLMYYNDEAFMPPRKPSSYKHASAIIQRTLLATPLKDILIGYTEATKKKMNHELIRYPIKVLHQKQTP